MSQEADGSILVSLLWCLWVCWIFGCWIDEFSSITRKGSEKPPKEEPLRGIAEPADAIHPTAASRNVTSGPSSTTASFLTGALAEIERRDRTFGPDDFLNNAAAAYEDIIHAFATGDRSTLRRMVSPEVYETFLANIRERESRGEAAEVRFIHVAPPTFESAVVSGDEAEITLQLTAELFNIAHGGPGAAPPRNSPGIVKTTDWWTFAKKLSAPSPAWTLVATAESASDLTTGTKA